VLQSAHENHEARRELERRGLSMVRSDWLGRLGRQLGVDALSIGDLRKSWDVLLTAEFLASRLAKDAPIVDFGAFHSEITGVLHRMGFTNLHGVDLNPRLRHGPYADRIQYAVRDFLDTGYPDQSFAAITSISAIEHGHAVDQLLAEVSRLLKPGGFLVGSTDYWPDKIDTRGVEIFGMDWTIFSAGEMADLFRAARERGLVPVGPLNDQAAAPSIDYAGRHYTFAWFALQKQGA
jgi:SAM-dependent methyltransferase